MAKSFLIQLKSPAATINFKPKIILCAIRTTGPWAQPEKNHDMVSIQTNP